MGNPEATDTDTGANPYPGERRTRLSSIWTALAVAIVTLAAILVFILQNPSGVELSFLVFHGHPPLAIALLFAMMLGAVVVMASGAARILQLRGVARRARSAQANASRPEVRAAAADEGPPPATR